MDSPDYVVPNVTLVREPIFSGTVTNKMGAPLKDIPVSLYHWHPDNKGGGKWDIYVTRKTLSQLLNGRTGISPASWLQPQNQYDLARGSEGWRAWRATLPRLSDPARTK